MARMRNADWIIVSSENQEVRCQRCGDRIPFPLGTIDWVTGVLKAFNLAHQDCKPGGRNRRTWFAERRVPDGGHDKD